MAQGAPAVSPLAKYKLVGFHLFTQVHLICRQLRYHPGLHSMKLDWLARALELVQSGSRVVADFASNSVSC